MMPNESPAIRPVSAEERNQISQGLYAYCRGLDRFDRELALSPFLAEAPFNYSEMFVGRAEDFMDWVWKSHESFSLHVHRVANIYIERNRADELVSESYVQVLLRAVADGKANDTIASGRYVDRWVTIEEKLFIAERDFITDVIRTASFDHAQPTGGEPAELSAKLVWARSREDASYRHFNGERLG